jgi:hypothetical protein
MDVHYLTSTAVERHAVDDLAELLERDDGFIWVDIPRFDDAAGRLLSRVFGFHERALRLCSERNHPPRHMPIPTLSSRFCTHRNLEASATCISWSLTSSSDHGISSRCTGR